MVTIVLQIATLPILVHYWGVVGFGTWVTLAAIPTYLSLSDLGFAQVAASEMSMAVGAKDYDSALTIFQSMMAIILILSAVVMFGTVLMVFALPLVSIFNLHDVSPNVARTVILVLSTQVLITLLFSVAGAGLRASGHFARLVYYNATSRLLEQLGVILVAALGAGMIAASCMILIVRAVVTLIAALTLLRLAPWISFGFVHARIKVAKRLFVPSVTFMAYVFGDLISIQGVTLVVAALFGPVAVASFSAMRTLARLGPQFATILSWALQPEYSFIFGSENMDRYRKLLKRHTAITAGIATVYVAGMLLLSHWALHIWTGGKVQPFEPLFMLIVFACAAEIIWASGQMPLLSVNKHQIGATTYLMLSASSIVLMNFAAKIYGIDWIGIIGLVVSLLMVLITYTRVFSEFFTSAHNRSSPN